MIETGLDGVVIVEPRVHAERPQYLALEVGNAPDPGFRPDHQFAGGEVQGLAEIDPGIASGALGIGGHVIAADEFGFLAGYLEMGVGGADLSRWLRRLSSQLRDPHSGRCLP